MKLKLNRIVIGMLVCLGIGTLCELKREKDDIRNEDLGVEVGHPINIKSSETPEIIWFSLSGLLLVAWIVEKQVKRERPKA
jgi:hypothetical protein